MQELSGIIVKHIRTEGAALVESMAAGAAQDYSAYSRMVGYLEGMRRAAEIVAERDTAWMGDITGTGGDHK